jgi:hypothetical protein
MKLLDTIQADVQKSDNWLKIICCTCIEIFFRAVSLLDKKLMTAQIATGLKKCQLFNTIYSKENGIHVQQLS